MSFRNNINNIAIAGAGLMGASLAQIFAQYGYKVTVFDISDESIKNGKNLIRINQHTLIAEEKISADQSQKIVENISFTNDTTCFSTADFVIEAIIENLSIKKKFWEEISEIVPGDAILTTNTSGLSISEISQSIKIPERFAGMHWVNPPHIVPLVEVISGDKTALETVEIVRNLALSVHKKPILVKKDAKGFVLNRLQYAVLREALYIVENGIADLEDVDNVMKYGLGMRYACIGPFETVDLGGLDTFFTIGGYLFADLSDQKDVPSLLREKYEEKAYGIKTGRGFYDYSNGRAEEVINRRDEKFLKISECLFGDL